MEIRYPNPWNLGHCVGFVRRGEAGDAQRGGEGRLPAAG